MSPTRTIIVLAAIILAALWLAPRARPSIASNVNRARRTHAHPLPYRTTRRLTATAQDRSDTAARHGTVAWFDAHIHDNLALRQANHGVTRPDKAEIAGYGFSTPRSLVAAYMRSPDHRAIILTSHRTLQNIGCGVAGTFTVCDFSGTMHR